MAPIPRYARAAAEAVASGKDTSISGSQTSGGKRQPTITVSEGPAMNSRPRTRAQSVSVSISASKGAGPSKSKSKGKGKARAPDYEEALSEKLQEQKDGMIGERREELERTFQRHDTLVGNFCLFCYVGCGS